MALEIERKFSVRGDAWRAEAQPGQHLCQGYLQFEPDEVRVRLVDDTKATLTVKGAKSADGMTRVEIEQEIHPIAARALLARALGVVEKTRFKIPQGDLTWEVDVYEGKLAGMQTAEIEMPSATTSVDLPPWIGTERTADKSYGNGQLARHGRPTGEGPRTDPLAQSEANARRGISGRR